MTMVTRQEAFTDAIRFWERGRIVYNLVLALIVLAYFVAGWPVSKTSITVNLLLGLFVLAVLANIAYCAAYPVDVFAQMSGVRDSWLKYRWLLLAIGIAFASIITRFIAQSMFTDAA
jgi:hypothetical protein